MDSIRCAHVEVACKKEDANGEHRPDAEANHRRNAAKSLQSGNVPQLACLKSGTEFVAVGPHSRLSATGSLSTSPKLPDLLLLVFAKASVIEGLSSFHR